MELQNPTRFPAQLAILPDKDGFETLVVIWKPTWTVARERLVPAEEPLEIIQADTFYGEPGESSIHRESDLALFKPATDVVLLGHAYAPKAKAKEGLVKLTVGPVSQTACVSGDRKWGVTLGFVRISGPEPFERVPLLFERSFGGRQPAKGGKGYIGAEERNPVGTGYVRKKRRSFVDGLALPNIEDPRRRLRSPGQKPPPVGFGFVGRHWLPRRRYAGTYDAAWEANRLPLLPEDFDERMMNGAPGPLQAIPHLKGGEQVQAEGVHPRGPWRFRLPDARPSFEAHWQGSWQKLDPVLDTIVLEPDLERVSLTYRARLRIHQHFRALRAVRVKEG